MGQQRMSHVRHPQEIRQKQLLRSWRCLVQELRKPWGFEVWTHVVRGHRGVQSSRDDCYYGDHFRYQQQRMSHVRHPQEIRQKQLLWSWRCLVQELRKPRGFEVWTHVVRGHRGVQRNTIDGPDEANSLDHLSDVRHKREIRQT